MPQTSEEKGPACLICVACQQTDQKKVPHIFEDDLFHGFTQFWEFTHLIFFHFSCSSFFFLVILRGRWNKQAKTNKLKSSVPKGEGKIVSLGKKASGSFSYIRNFEMACFFEENFKTDSSPRPSCCGSAEVVSSVGPSTKEAHVVRKKILEVFQAIFS